MPGAIALAGIFLVILVEMIFHPCRKFPPKQEAVVTSNPPPTDNEVEVSDGRGPPTDPTGPLRDMGILVGRTSSIGRSLTRVNDHGDADNISHTRLPMTKDGQSSGVMPHEGHALSMAELATSQTLRKARLQCVLLEVGILFHSIFIGMALSVSIGSEFVILLIAIAFHRK